jgi:hypothetical protein
MAIPRVRQLEIGCLKAVRQDLAGLDVVRDGVLPSPPSKPANHCLVACNPLG